MQRPSRIMRQLTQPPWLYATIFFGCGLVLILTIWLPYKLARHTATTQALVVQKAAQQARSTAAGLRYTGQFGSVTPGQSGTVKTFVNNLQDYTSNFDPAELSDPVIAIPPLTPPNVYPARYIKTVNQNIRGQKRLRAQARTSLAQAKRILVHQTQVAHALTNVLSYNAKTDFTTFDLKSGDTKKRLELARNGLLNTRNKLTSLKTSDDPGIDQLIDRIDRLIAARDKLEKDGNVGDWTAAVQLAQGGIVLNRNNYWAEATGDLTSRLATTSEQLEAAVASWQALIAGKL